MKFNQLSTLVLVYSLLSSSLGISVALATAPQKTALTTNEKFAAYWSYTPLIVTRDSANKENKNQSSQLERKFFKREIWIKNLPLTIAETSFFYLKNPQDKDKGNKIDAIATQINLAYSNVLKITKNKNVLSLEGDFEKTNRFMKISLTQTKDSFLIITTSMRSGFAKNLNPEVTQLHNVLLTYKGDFKIKKTSFFNWNNLIPTAHAEGLNFNLKDLLTTSNVTTGINTNVSTPVVSSPGFMFGETFSSLENSLSGLQTTVGDLNGTFGNTNEQFGVANQNWNNSNIQFGNLNTTLDKATGDFTKLGNEANKNWDNSNKQIDKLTNELGTQAQSANKNWDNTNKQLDKITNELSAKADDVNKNWDNTNKQVDKALEVAKSYEKQADQFNSNWAETNKLLAKTVDPAHMAKVAAYTAMGAALGGVAINLAMQGVVQGISVLHEMFTGAKQKKLEWSDFQKAMELWDTQLNDLIKMEKMVDGYINAFAFFEGQNLGNDYEKQLNISMRDMKFDRDIFMEKFKEQNQPMVCRKLYYDASLELDGKVQEYDKILQFASANNISMFGTNYFCNQLKELQRRLLQAETQMQDVRLKILVAENQFYKKQKETILDRDKDIAKINSREKNVANEEKKANKFTDKRLKENNKNVKNAWMSQCMKGENATGVDLKDGLGQKWYSFNYFKMKSGCKEVFKGLTNKAIEKDLGRALVQHLEKEMTKNLNLEANYNVILI